jgi:hypothetical protein
MIDLVQRISESAIMGKLKDAAKARGQTVEVMIKDLFEQYETYTAVANQIGISDQSLRDAMHRLSLARVVTVVSYKRVLITDK